MDGIKKKINIALLKLSVNKWDLLKELDVSNIDGLITRFGWDEILAAMVASESYLTAAVKKLYTDILEREADPDGLRSHIYAYGIQGWRVCLQGLLGSDEYRDRKGGKDAAAKAVLTAMWRDLTDGRDPPDLDELASLPWTDAIDALLSRQEVAAHQSGRLWQRLTGNQGGVPETVISAFTRAGPEEAIRAICDLPEFEHFVNRHRAKLPFVVAVPPVGEAHGRPAVPVLSDTLNPYKGRPPHTYWNSGVAVSGAETDPMVGAPFSISRTDAIATAGSCFAQHLSKSLAAQGHRYLVTEQYHGHPGVADEGYAVYPARFGNIYTARHLLQLFERAYGLRVPQSDYWQGEEGRFIDPFRPRIQEGGFPSIETLLEDRERHYRAVRQMFEQCRVFIFTLGLTETWISPVDGSVYPLAPGVVASRVPDDDPQFHNHSVGEVSSDLDRFLALFFEVNPAAQVILTVSPVPLIATYEDRHVLVSTVASKSILRAAVDEVCRRHDGKVTYFPSYEIITGPQSAAQYYREDLREVTEEGVAFVMSVFGRHFLSSGLDDAPIAPGAASEEPAAVELREEDIARFSHFVKVVCDEEAILG